MSGSGDLLGTAISGLVAFQRNLAVTGHNISNVNTEGYTRQTVEMATRNANISGSGYIGSGVEATTVKRVYDQLLFDQLTNRQSSFNQFNTLNEMATRVDSMLGEDLSGLAPVLQSFFDSMHGVSTSPTSIPARQVLLTDAESLVSRFGILNGQLDDLRNLVNNQLEVLTQEVSGIASSIAAVNQDIAIQKGLAGGQPPNDLLDRRDLLVNRLSEIISVSTVEADDGSLNVFIGSGQSLVLGTTASELTVARNNFDQSQFEVSFTNSGTSFSISEQLSGGMIGGLLEFREDILNPTQNSLGRIAIALADQMNTQHQAGDDINGDQGGLFFNAIVSSSPEVLTNSNNDPTSDTVSVAITDTNLLRASDYRLNYDGTTFTLTRLSDNTVVGSGGALPLAADGISVDVAGGASYAAGDSFLIRPVRQGAADIAVVLKDAAKFAAAGDGQPLGDNSNALALASMQNQKLMGGGTETYQTAYGKLVANVGVKTSEARINASAQSVLVQRASDSMASLSGVNLDEEAAALLKFQQSYQAAARVISVANDIFQTLLNAASR